MFTLWACLTITVRGEFGVLITGNYIASHSNWIRFSVFITSMASAIILEVLIVLAIIVNTFLLFWSWISLGWASEALTSDSPDLPGRCRKIALDAVHAFIVRVEVVFAIFAATIWLQFLVIFTVNVMTSSIVGSRLHELIASNAVTHIIADLSFKVAFVLHALSSVVVGSLAGLTLLASSILLQNRLGIANVLDAFLSVLIWIVEQIALFALAIRFLDSLVTLTRLLDAVLAIRIRSIVVWALLASSISMLN
jgi:hypothetical protein